MRRKSCENQNLDEFLQEKREEEGYEESRYEWMHDPHVLAENHSIFPFLKEKVSNEGEKKNIRSRKNMKEHNKILDTEKTNLHHECNFPASNETQLQTAFFIFFTPFLSPFFLPPSHSLSTHGFIIIIIRDWRWSRDCESKGKLFLSWRSSNFDSRSLICRDASQRIV